MTSRRPLTLLALIALTACSDGLSPPHEQITQLPRDLTPVEERVIVASNSFGTELFRRVAVSDPRANVIVSPLSASMALGMTLNGAASTTFDAMATALGFEGLSREEIDEAYRGLIDLLVDLDPDVTFEIANAIWADEGFPFRDAFFQAVAAAFDARAETRDFADPATVTVINQWVEENTHGLIDSIVDTLDPSLVMLLVNAMYYEAVWTLQFDPHDTRPADFTREDDTSVRVDMMHLDEAEVPFRRTADYTAVELPYGGEAFSMLIVVPTGDMAVRDFVDTLSPSEWAALVDGLAPAELAYVELPKFTLTYDGYLNDALKSMGMQEAFEPGADFTALSPLGDQLCISFVRQKTYIEVDERGTRAAAVTAVGIGVTSSPPAFIADRPFVFAIRERLSGTVLFAGVVGDPTAADPGAGEAPSDCT